MGNRPQDSLQWMGRDLDTMTKDELIEVIRQLKSLLDSTNMAARSVIEMARDLRGRG